MAPSLTEIIDYTRSELSALQAGGMDGVCIGNQQDWPYSIGVGSETTALVTRIISEASSGLSIPIGITLFWDDIAAIAVAKAIGAKFVRGIFRGSYAGEMGMLNLNAADALRFRKTIDAENIKLMFIAAPHPLHLNRQSKFDLGSEKLHLGIQTGRIRPMRANPGRISHSGRIKIHISQQQGLPGSDEQRSHSREYRRRTGSLQRGRCGNPLTQRQKIQ